ncbi:MAG: glutamyl-tRNA reductase [Pyrinomonadaceae bacterium]
MTQPKTLFAFGLNHKTAPVEIREKLYVTENELQPLLARLGETLSECMVLSTCNRTEVYGVSESADLDIDRYKRLLIEFKGAEGEVEDAHFFEQISCSACQQLFHVSTSIDSKVIGDLQILRQLRAAYFAAKRAGTTGKVLNQLLQRAFKLGKQVYNETAIHEGAVSASLAAVELAQRTFGSLQGRTVMVIGAGEMAKLTTEALAVKRVGKIVVTNRTRAHAEELLDSIDRERAFESSVVEFADFKYCLDSVDIIISSTGSPEPILHRSDLDGLMRKLLIIDIAVPRDVDTSVGEHPGVVLKNIDDLNTIAIGNHERRLRDLPKVKKLIMGEMVDFLTWYYTLPLLPNYEKTGVKPSPAQTQEVLRIKSFLANNVSEIHRLYANSNGNFREDLASHFDLIDRLRAMKARSLAAAAV